MTLALLFLKKILIFTFTVNCNALLTKVKIYIHEKYKLIEWNQKGHIVIHQLYGSPTLTDIE